MTVPDQPHIVFKQNPLEEVICQLKFPPVLKIDAGSPVTFQEAIRSAYPLYEENVFNGGVALPPELRSLLGAAMPGPQQLQRMFSSADTSWHVTIARDFMALSTKKYQRWSDFRSHLEGPLQALIEAYAPAFFARVGLRYRNIIRPSGLGLQDRPWAELLTPHIACELADENARGDIVQAGHQIMFRLAEHGAFAMVRHGLPKESAGSERGYVIDIDTFTQERTELGNVLQVLNYLNNQAHNLFGWCIADPLRQALDPQPIVA